MPGRWLPAAEARFVRRLPREVGLMGRICGSALLMLACSSTAGHAQACRWVRPDSSFVRAKVDTFSRGGFGTGEDLGLQYDTIQLYVDHDCETAVVIDWGAGGGALVILRSDGRVVYSNAYDNMEVHRGAGRTHVAISFRAVRGTGIGASRFVVLCGFAMDVWSECLDIEQDRGFRE